MPSEHIQIKYKKARKHILDGDVLLYGGSGSVSATAIQIGTTSPYSHVGMAGWTNGNPNDPYNDLMAYEMLWSGGQGHHLSSHVDTRDGVHVYRVSDTHTQFHWNQKRKIVVGDTKVFDRKKAVHLMREFCRPGEYGKMHLFWAALTRVPLLRILYRQPTDDELADRSRPPHCGEAVSYVLRQSFTDMVRNTPDHYTSPGALARSPLLHYMFTLVP